MKDPEARTGVAGWTFQHSGCREKIAEDSRRSFAGLTWDKAGPGDEGDNDPFLRGREALVEEIVLEDLGVRRLPGGGLGPGREEGAVFCRCWRHGSGFSVPLARTMACPTSGSTHGEQRRGGGQSQRTG